MPLELYVVLIMTELIMTVKCPALRFVSLSKSATQVPFELLPSE